MAAVTPPPLELTVTHNTSTSQLKAVEKEVRMHITAAPVAKLVMDYLTPSIFSLLAGTTLGSSSMFRFGETPVEIKLRYGNHRLSEFFFYSVGSEAARGWGIVDYRTLSRRAAVIADIHFPNWCAGYENIFYRMTSEKTCIISDIGGSQVRDLHTVKLPPFSRRWFDVVSAEQDNRQLIAADHGVILRVSEEGTCTLFDTKFFNASSLRQIAPDKIVLVGSRKYRVAQGNYEERERALIEIWDPSKPLASIQVVITETDAELVHAQIVSDGIVVVQPNSSHFVSFSDITRFQPLASIPSLRLDPTTTPIFDDFFVVDDCHLISTDPHFPHYISLSIQPQNTESSSSSSSSSSSALKTKKRKRADLNCHIHYGHGPQLFVGTTTGSASAAGPLYSFNFLDCPTKK